MADAGYMITIDGRAFLDPFTKKLAPLWYPTREAAEGDARKIVLWPARPAKIAVVPWRESDNG